MTALKKEQQQWCVWVGQAGIDGKILTLKKDCTLFRLTLALPWTAKTTCPSLKKNIGTSSIIFNAATIFLPTRRAPFHGAKLLIAALNFSKVCFLEESSAEEQKSCGSSTVPNLLPWTIGPGDFWRRISVKRSQKTSLNSNWWLKQRQRGLKPVQCAAQSKISGKD